MGGTTPDTAPNPRYPHLVYDDRMRGAAALAITTAVTTGEVDYRTLVGLHLRATYGQSTGPHSAMSAFQKLASVAAPNAFELDGPAGAWMNEHQDGPQVDLFSYDDVGGTLMAARSVQVQPDNR